MRIQSWRGTWWDRWFPSRGWCRSNPTGWYWRSADWHRTHPQCCTAEHPKQHVQGQRLKNKKSYIITNPMKLQIRKSLTCFFNKSSIFCTYIICISGWYFVDAGAQADTLGDCGSVRLIDKDGWILVSDHIDTDKGLGNLCLDGCVKSGHP